MAANRFCRHCGFPTPTDATFCATCGTPTGNEPDHAAVRDDRTPPSPPPTRPPGRPRARVGRTGTYLLGVTALAATGLVLWIALTPDTNTNSPPGPAAQDQPITGQPPTPTTTGTTASPTTTTLGQSAFSNRTIKVAVENGYPPFNFIDGTGNGVGFDYDVWNEICRRLGCEASFVEAGWPAIIAETGAGIHDVAADGISITDSRKEVVDFSDPYMTIVQRLLVRIDETRFTNFGGFTAGDYRLGTVANTTNHELGVSLVGASRVDGFAHLAPAVDALVTGEVDAVIIDDTAGQGYIGAHDDLTKLITDDLQSDQLGFLYPRGSTLIGPVNDVLKAMVDDGTLADLVRKWFVDESAG